jgi:formate dehydrogenase iron-sulfur subunit
MSAEPAERRPEPAGPGFDPAGHAGHTSHPPRMGFFTDTSVCIGCKACEVACKEWNAVPEDGIELSGMSYDNTVGLGASTWRHVAFIEQIVRRGSPVWPSMARPWMARASTGRPPSTRPAG